MIIQKILKENNTDILNRCPTFIIQHFLNAETLDTFLHYGAQVAHPCPRPTSELYRNRKWIFCIKVQLIDDADLMIRNFVARWPGLTHDAPIFDNSHICCQLDDSNEGGYLLWWLPLQNMLAHSFPESPKLCRKTFQLRSCQDSNYRWTTVRRMEAAVSFVAAGLRTKIETT